MLSKVNATSILGIDGYKVTVETDFTQGVGYFAMVGLAEVSVKEAKDRVSSALGNTGFRFPNGRLTINLAPADIKKDGSNFDLAIAVGVLLASGQIIQERNVAEYAFIAELSLDGKLRGVRGVLPMVLCLKKEGIKYVVVSAENAQEAAVVSGIHVIAANTLGEVASHISANSTLERVLPLSYSFSTKDYPMLDFADVKGQESAKRALEIAAAGAHNVLMIGPPGSGKTMLAKRIVSILPDLTIDESLEITKIYSVAGLLGSNESLIKVRPFRSPHHTMSPISLSGGGRLPRPGEVSLSHLGVLYLDEFAEFPKQTLEILRQPIEDGSVTISRVNASLTYPASFMLLASMNPCPCGYLGDERHECTCSEGMIAKYISKISGPLLDRIDIHIEVPGTNYENLNSTYVGEHSSEIKKRVNQAREIQLNRYKKEKIFFNSGLGASQVAKYCRLGQREDMLMKKAYDTLGLSARGYHRILKLARTIADLEGSENITTNHLSEAIQYRNLDKKYFKNIK